MTEEMKKTVGEFKAAVNMSASQIEKWLETDESKEVGQKKSEGAESVGHQSGRRIIELLGKKQEDYAEEDLAHMHKVVSYVRRHSAQKPDGDIKETHWRYSLMNWGHDPLREK